MIDYFEFETKAEQELWNEELCTQLSDGWYEGTGAEVNWQFWAGLKTKVGFETRVHSTEHVKMNTEIDFTEVDFLFTPDESGVRYKYSQVKKETLNKYLKRISEAMNKFAEIDKDYNPHRE